MSNLKIGEDQYIGKQELARFQTFLSDDGYKKLIRRLINTYGVVFDNVYSGSLQVTAGSSAGKISVRSGSLVGTDLNVAIMENDAIDIATIPAGTIKYVYGRKFITNQEVGTVSIDGNGNVVGVGTKFTQVLRGQPANASKIRFINSDNNTLDYEVLTVISDTSLVIQAPVFVAEANLRYGVVGTFSPSVVIDAASKMIFTYDTMEITLSDTVIATDGYSLLAVADYSDSVNLILTDRRKDNRFTILLTPSSEQNGFIAMLNKVETFTGMQTFAQGGELQLLSKQISLGEDGNSFVVNMRDAQLQYITDKPLGTIIQLSFLDAVNLSATIVNAVNNSAPAGFAPILAYQEDATVTPFDVLTFQRMNIEASGSVSAPFHGWVMTNHSDSYRIATEALTKVDSISNDALIARLDALDAQQVILKAVAAPFLNKGAMVLWKKPFADIPVGWQECVDWRGRMPMGYNPGVTNYQLGDSYGSDQVTLQMRNMVPHTHAFNPGDQNGRSDNANDRDVMLPGSTNRTTGSAGGEDGIAKPFSVLNPYRIVVFIEYIGAVS